MQAYLVRFEQYGSTYIEEAYESKADAKQAVKQKAEESRGTWEKVNERVYIRDDSKEKVRVEEVELHRDEVDPRKETRW